MSLSIRFFLCLRASICPLLSYATGVVFNKPHVSFHSFTYLTCVCVLFTSIITVQAAPQEVDPELRKKLKETIAQADSFNDRFEAEVWLVQKSSILAKYVKDDSKRLQILHEVHKAAKRVEIPPEFVLAVIQIESHFNSYAVSSAGAQGMMQVMPFWKKEIGREHDNLIDMRTNLKYGCTILRHYLDRAKGNWTEALARYNGSYGKAKYPRKVLLAWEKNWR